MDVWTQAMILAYHQIRQMEEDEDKVEMAKAMIPRF